MTTDTLELLRAGELRLLARTWRAAVRAHSHPDSWTHGQRALVLSGLLAWSGVLILLAGAAISPDALSQNAGLSLLMMLTGATATLGAPVAAVAVLRPALPALVAAVAVGGGVSVVLVAALVLTLVPGVSALSGALVAGTGASLLLANIKVDVVSTIQRWALVGLCSVVAGFLGSLTSAGLAALTMLPVAVTLLFAWEAMHPTQQLQQQGQQVLWTASHAGSSDEEAAEPQK